MKQLSIGLALWLSLVVTRTAEAACLDDNGGLAEVLTGINAAHSVARDWSDYRQLTDWDQAQLYSAYREGPIRGPRIHSSIGLTLHDQRVDGFTLCRDSTDIPSQLNSIWAGLTFSLDDTRADWGLRGYYFGSARGFYSFLDAQGRPTGTSAHEQLGDSRSLVLGEFHWKRWISLGAGYLSPGASSHVPGVTRPDVLGKNQGGHPVLSLGIPRYRLHSLFVFGGDVISIEQAAIGMSRIPLSGSPLDVSWEVAQLSREQQVYSALGLGISVLEQKSLSSRVALEVAPEFIGPRLRFVRAEAAASLHDLIGRSVAPKGPLWFDLRALARGSYFHGRYLEQTTGSSGAWGWELGGSLQVGVPVATLFLEFTNARNRPEDLVVPQLVDLPVHSLTMGLRLSPWSVFGWEAVP